MDVKIDSVHGHFDVDIVVPSVATTDEQELARRRRDPTRAVRAAVAGKVERYGPSVVALAVDDAGRMAASTKRFLHALAQSLAPGDPQAEFCSLRAQLQHLVMQGTASMAQAARGAPRAA
jgi:hypothetical protein